MKSAAMNRSCSALAVTWLLLASCLVSSSICVCQAFVPATTIATSNNKISTESLLSSSPSSVLPSCQSNFRSKTLLRATWSDIKAVRDYQAFLASGKQNIELSKDMPSVIIVPSNYDNNDKNEMEYYNKLAETWQKLGIGGDVVITADLNDLAQIPATLDDNNEYPIYISLPPWQIADFLQNLPDALKDRAEDFVFFSGGPYYGNIEDVLKEKGYCRDTMTQVLLSGLRITPMNTVQEVSIDLGLDANGENKKAGLCIACGKWSGSVAERLERGNVQCRTDFYREWRRHMWERNVYDAVFSLLGAVRDQTGTTMADVAKYYEEEVGDVVWEMSQLLRGWKALTLTYGFEERIFALAEFQDAERVCTMDNEKMYPYLWGNPVFLESRNWVDYLLYAQREKGYLPNVALPDRPDDSYTSNMRQGNLRADGVV